MQLTNLSNTFTAFGSFAVFDEDTMTLINRLYSDCNIAINQEPNNPNNKSGKVMRITNPTKHYTMTLRPNRLDVQMPGVNNNNFNQLLNNVSEIFINFAEMFEGCYATRLAYVSSDFVFDDNGSTMQILANTIPFISKQTPTQEVSLRINTPEKIQDEMVNVVLNISNVMIGNNKQPQAPQRRAIMITHDINTLSKNNDPRFDLKYVIPYFEEMHQISKDHLVPFENL